MKNSLNKFKMFASVAAILSVAAAQAATVTWNNSGGGSNFNTDGNWVGGTAPVSGVDTVALVGSAGTAFMSTPFTVASGQSFTDNNSGLPVRLSAGGHLTVESGGTVNLSALAESGTGALTVKLEFGSSVTTGNLFTGNSSNWAWEFVSDSAGVSVLNATGGILNTLNNKLFLDLTDYDHLTNGNFIPVIDYNGTVLMGDFSQTLISGGAYAIDFVDYAYDLGGGNLGIAVHVIQSAPEPSSLALLLIGGALLGSKRKKSLQSR